MKDIILCSLILLHVASCVSIPRRPDFNSVIRTILAENRNVLESQQQGETDERLLENEAYPYNITPTNEIMNTVGHEGQTAFYSYLSSPKCYQNGITFKFNVAPVNIGNGYNVNTGIFVAPATGLYVFTWTVAADHRTWFSAQLVVNSVVKGVVMADSDIGGRASGIHPATGSVLANVRGGEHVFVRFITGHGCGVRSSNRIYNTFSGYQIA